MNEKRDVSFLTCCNIKIILKMTTQAHNHGQNSKRSLAVDIIILKEKLLKIHLKNQIKIIKKQLLVDNSGV
jgi:hypothetical protein